MTKNQAELLTNPKIFVVLIVAVASVLVITAVPSQNAMATIIQDNADMDVDEAAEEAGNATKTMSDSGMNQTAVGNMTDVQFLSIQNAQSGSLSQVNDTAYILELSNVSDSTILFSDRPNRIVTSVSTSDFVGNWTTGPDSFASDAPNDALIVKDMQTGNLETAVIELFSPVYNPNTNTSKYTIMAENGTVVELPNEFGQSVLIIDEYPQHWIIQQ